jgi:predicted O-methyltransferase YrrM
MKLTDKSPQDLLNELTAKHPELEAVMAEVRATVPPLKREVAPYQAATLYDLAKRYDGGRILEIGTAWGYSAAMMARAAPKAQIITLNPNVEEVKIAKKNLDSYKNVTVETLKSWQYLQEYKGAPFDLIFVDGDHKRVRADLPFWEHVAAGGIFFFHDYSPDGTPRACPPVYEAVNAFTVELGKTEPDILVVDNTGVGMAGFIKPKKKSDRQKLAHTTSLIGGAHAYSMLSWNHLSELYALAQTVVAAGDVVECGCWQGGSACLLYTGAKQTMRRLVVFDTLDGMPKPDPAVDGDKALNKWQTAKDRGEVWCGVEQDAWANALQRLKIDVFNTFLHAGDWTQLPFPDFPDGIAILHVDATLYRSTKTALEGLYDKVSRGGVVTISAYGHWGGVKRAVDEFRNERSIDATLYTIDRVNVWWRKP